MFTSRNRHRIIGSDHPHETESLDISEDGFQLQPKNDLRVNTEQPRASPTASPYTIERFENTIDDSPNTTQPLKDVSRSKAAWRYPRGVVTAIFIADLILTILPIGFLVLAFEALSVNGKPITSSHGNAVQQAAKIGPTVFPIVFAAVVGRLMRTYALYSAERGTLLGTLEQLIGSQNMLAAFERAIMLPGLGIVSTGIILLWALSPIGGQSTLRVLGQGNRATFGNSTLYYFNDTGSGNYGGFMGASAYSTYSPSMNAVFLAALTSLQLVNGSDIWGNIKIPVLQEMDSYKKGLEQNGWYGFDESSYNSSYASLTGIVTSGLQDGLQTQFTMQASYFNLTCPDVRLFNTTTSSEDWGGFAEWAMSTPLMLRGTNQSLLFNGYANSVNPAGYSTNSYMVDSNYNVSNAESAGPLPVFNIIYASQSQEDGSLWAYNCTVGKTVVEVRLACNGSVCAIKSMRHADAPPNTTGWPFPTPSIASIYNFVLWLGSATSNLQSGTVSALDFYMSGSDTPFNLSLDIDYANITGAYFATRLQSIMNTGWQISFQNAATAQKPNTNLTALQLSTNMSTISTFDGGVGYAVSKADGVTVDSQAVFVANKGWIAVTIIISFVLLICAVVSMFFKYGSHSPDILGSVSSLTRDNPNFEQIPGGDRLDGLARARLMRHVRVQIVDTQPWGDGHITLRNLGHRVRPPKDRRPSSVIR